MAHNGTRMDISRHTPQRSEVSWFGLRKEGKRPPQQIIEAPKTLPGWLGDSWESTKPGERHCEVPDVPQCFIWALGLPLSL